MKIDNVKRIIKEDFPEDQQDLVDRLAYSLNPFMDQVEKVVNGNLGIDNLTRQFISITLENDSSGDLKYPVQFKTNLTRPMGMPVIRAENITNPAIYPTNQPFISFSTNGNLVTILNVSGIQQDNKYRLTLEVIS